MIINFKLLTQHILRASSVGAGSLSLKTETYIAIIRLPGKESNLTQPMVSYTGTTFLSTLEGVMRSLPLSPRHAVQVKQGSQSLSTLYLYYIKSNRQCQVFFRFFFLFFHSLGRISIVDFGSHPIFFALSWYFLYWFAVCVRQLDPFKSFLLFSLVNLSI